MRYLPCVSTVAASSRRERKKNATQEAIHDAALSLTEELGLASVTVEAITERADVAPRTFFNHFPSKVHAVLGKDPDRLARVRQALESRPADESPLTALRHVLVEDFLPDDTTAASMLRRFRLLRAEPTLLSTLHAEFEETERAMVAAIAGRIGQPETDLYPALVVSVAVSAVRVAIMRWCERDGQGSLQPVINEAFDHLADGLVVPQPEGSAK
jgi:AcrR family transcriptional regulator